MVLRIRVVILSIKNKKMTDISSVFLFVHGSGGLVKPFDRLFFLYIEN